MKFSHRNTLTKATQRPGWEDTNVNLHFLSKFAKTRNLFHESSFFHFSVIQATQQAALAGIYGAKRHQSSQPGV